MKNTEIWLPIEGYDGTYEVSSEGRVRSLNYLHTWRTQVMKPKMSSNGYLYVVLCKDGEQKQYRVHRLVTEAFLLNPDNLPQVNHKDENKANNAVTNLEWCTAKNNCNHGTRNARVSTAMTNGKLSKPVQQLSLDGVLVALWPSLHEAWRQTAITCQSISGCCKGKYRTAGGYVWKYAR